MRAWLVLGLGIVLVGGPPRAMSDPAASPAADEKLLDYRGKGDITIIVDAGNPATQTPPVTMAIQMEQVFRKPGTILLKLNLAGGGLSQSFLSEPGLEQSYNPVQGFIVEKRYKNLDKATTNPLLALQASMYDFGRKIRSARSRREMGSVTLLGYPCDIVELDSREILQDLSAGGLLSGQRGAEFRSGRTKVWVAREYHLPVRIELYGGQEKPLMTVAFTELQVNAGVGSGDLRLDAPNGTRKLSVTADMADPEWESKMEDELRQLVNKTSQERSGARKSGGS